MTQYLIIALVWVVSLVGVGVGVGAWQNEAGHISERVDWQAREATELNAANLTIKTLQDAYRTAERIHGETQAIIAANYEGKLSNAIKQRSADLSAIRAGTLRLRDPAAASVSSCSDSVPGVAAGARLGDGRAPGELSGIAAEFLDSESIRADSVAEQLAACQQIVKADRARRPINNF